LQHCFSFFLQKKRKAQRATHNAQARDIERPNACDRACRANSSPPHGCDEALLPGTPAYAVSRVTSAAEFCGIVDKSSNTRGLQKQKKNLQRIKNLLEPFHHNLKIKYIKTILEQIKNSP
jgi:hypothetical protein